MRIIKGRFAIGVPNHVTDKQLDDILDRVFLAIEGEEATQTFGFEVEAARNVEPTTEAANEEPERDPLLLGPGVEEDPYPDTDSEEWHEWHKRAKSILHHRVT